MNYVEVDPVQGVCCQECGVSSDDARLHYLYVQETYEIRGLCDKHYREYLVEMHGEETVRMLEESSPYQDAIAQGDM